jgi:hypothetical protein
MSERQKPSRVGVDGKGSGRPSLSTGLLDEVRDVAAKPSKQRNSRQVTKERHAQRVWRVRALIGFVREFSKGEERPDFSLAARAAIEDGLFNKKKAGDVELSLRMAWRKRSYYESDAAFDRLLSERAV